MLDLFPLIAMVLAAESAPVPGGGEDYSFPALSGTLSIADSYLGGGGGGGGGALQGGGGPETALAAKRWSVRGGLGFTADPTMFLMALEGDYHLFQNLAIGPLAQLAVSDEDLLIAPTLNAQYAFDLPNFDPLKPFVQGGLGFAYRNNEDCDCNEDIEFLINVGMGFDWFFSGNLAAGTSVLFNFFPDELLDDNFIFSWQIATLRWVF